MCGRADDDFGPAGWEVLTNVFGPLDWENQRTRSEVRPTDPIRFVRRSGNGFDAPYGRWGLVPHGMSLDDAKRYATFNARIESLEEKPMFRSAFLTRRSIVPLAAFWEWRMLPDGQKQKVRVARKDGKPLLAAGLWNAIETEEGPMESCTIVTRPPTADMADVHDRLPALLLTKDIESWLDGSPRLARVAALSSWQPGILRVTEA